MCIVETASWYPGKAAFIQMHFDISVQICEYEQVSPTAKNKKSKSSLIFVSRESKWKGTFVDSDGYFIL